MGVFDDLLYRTTLLTVVRGKCRYDRHESVRLVGGEWWGESSRGNECPFAPEDTCPVCEGAGQITLSTVADPSATYSAGTEVDPVTGERRIPCLPCSGSGFVPGPHWPYRFPQPPPLRIKN